VSENLILSFLGVSIVLFFRSQFDHWEGQQGREAEEDQGGAGGGEEEEVGRAEATREDVHNLLSDDGSC
jgi:hypothetical protein